MHRAQDEIASTVRCLSFLEKDSFGEGQVVTPAFPIRESTGHHMNISEVTRRSIIDYLIVRLHSGHPFYGRLGLISFLKRVWDLSSMPSTDDRFQNAEGDIWQHMINNNDWDYDYLLYTYLDLLKCRDDTFLAFLEICVHPVVVHEDQQLSPILSELNNYLAPDGYRLEMSGRISGRPTYKAARLKGAPQGEEPAYEVVLSFAGEDREYVERVAGYLKRNEVEVFYDKYEEVTLWGKDLSEHLDRVYRGSARYCVIFISQHYRDKIWTTYERRSALAKAIEQKTEYILPVRFDDTEIPGIRSTIGYVDLRDKTPEQLGEMILRKLGRVPKY